MNKNNVICRRLVKIYSQEFHKELRKIRMYGDVIAYEIWDNYDMDSPSCEMACGFEPYPNVREGIAAFERACGIKFTENYIKFLEEYDKTINI